MDTASITQLRTHRDELRKSLRGIKVSQYAGEEFGNEQEYVAKGVVAGIEAMLVDISALTGSTAKFIQNSTHSERTELVRFLANLNSYTKDKDLQSMAVTIDEIKPILRNFGIRNTTERKDAFIDHINDLQKSASNLFQHINDVADIKANGEALKEGIETLHQQLADKFVALKEQEETLEELIGSTEKNRSELAAMLTTDQSRSEEIEEYLSESKSHTFYRIC